jgi:16S rRNA (adenine1518-N6/adenine1519-N6)-dimethyltransferase
MTSREPRVSRSLPRARKRFGQHFLEPAWVTKVLDALLIQPTDRFVEVGPGRGALTAPLASRAAEVVAIEIDRDLAAHLARTAPPTVRIVEADVLHVEFAAAIGPMPAPVRLVGNLPYNVSAPILFKLFRESRGGMLLTDATVMLQHEVAQRLVAGPDDRDYGVLSVFRALHATARPLLALPPGAFRPPPRVHSAVVQLRFHPPPVDVGRPAVFEALVRGAFMHRRKTLLNAVRQAADQLGSEAAALIDRAGIDPTLRPGELSLADFAALSRAVL